MGQLTLILGGARSGKSTFAEHLAAESAGRVIYIATAEAGDEEMKTRIAAHRGKRPKEWTTYEIPRNLGAALETINLQAETVLLDCLTLLVSNLVLDVSPQADRPDEGAAQARLNAEIEALLAVVERSPARWLVVSNEVGLGLVPANPLGRVYRDLLGWANQTLARHADQVFLMTAGIPMPIQQFRYNQ